MLKLNLPEYEYLLKKEGERLFIFDPVRKKYIFLTPEEWVRQHFLNYLINIIKVPRNLVKMEGGLNYNSLTKRSDILIFDRGGQPLLLVECKSASVSINAEVVFQLATYNSRINAPFLSSTNGLQHYYWYRKPDGNYVKMEELPDYPSMLLLTKQQVD